jgi:RNA polymerase sigma factor (sigma-70 family)
MRMLFQSDPELLGRYVREGCEQSFASLVEAHEGMVVGTALRRTGDAELARDVAQQVFALLARKAAWLVGRDSIAGWLHRAACNVGARARRGEARARALHAEALQHAAAASRSDYARWEPLDEALAALAEKERTALLLRYFEDRSYEEVAARLGLSEAAARQRVSRGLRKLEDCLRRRGVGATSAALLTAAVAFQAQVPARAGLAAAALASNSATTPIALFITTVMSHTASKLAVATLVLAALPVAVLREQKSKVVAQNAIRAEQVPAAAPQSQLPVPGADSPAMQAEVQAAWDRLRFEESKRLAAEEKLVALEREVQRVESEVVVSYGQIEEMAGKAVKLLRLQRQLSQLEQLRREPDLARREMLAEKLLAKVMPSITELVSVGEEARRLEADTEKAARFYAALVGEGCALDEATRSSLLGVARGQLSAMNNAGLLAAQQPHPPQEAWIQARKSALQNLGKGLVEVLPVAHRTRVAPLINEFVSGFVVAGMDMALKPGREGEAR